MEEAASSEMELMSKGSDEEVANKTIDAIVSFYENDLHVPTHISAYDKSEDRSWVDEVEKK